MISKLKFILQKSWFNCRFVRILKVRYPLGVFFTTLALRYKESPKARIGRLGWYRSTWAGTLETNSRLLTHNYHTIQTYYIILLSPFLFFPDRSKQNKNKTLPAAAGDTYNYLLMIVNQSRRRPDIILLIYTGVIS